jgi:pimeloyl-ACP methyl ester carboxylesterase
VRRELPLTKRPTLILIPGLINSRVVWRHQIAALRDSATVLIADHGASDSIAAMAQRVLALAAGPVALAGHSMGGRVALEAYRSGPDRIVGLALLDTGFRPLPEGAAGRAEVAKRQAWVDLAHRDGTRAMVQNWVREMVYPGRLGDTLLLDEVVSMMSTSTPADFERQIRALIARPDAIDVLRAIRCPTLVLCGHEDSWAKPEFHEEMARLIPGSVLSVVPECGHMAPLERPEAVNAALLDWLTKVNARGN